MYHISGFQLVSKIFSSIIITTSTKQKKDNRLSVKIKGKELVTQHITKYVNSYRICTVKHQMFLMGLKKENDKCR